MEMLYEKQNYLADIDYIANVSIQEYDISKANINALKFMGRISDWEYDYLDSLDKQQREVYIGLKIKNDKSVYKSIQEGIMYAKRQFFKENDLSFNDILAIKNDAVFVINRSPRVTRFGTFNFSLKNIYNSFYKIPTPNGKLECYYGYDNITKVDTLDIKGISDESLELHKEYFLDFLTAVFYLYYIASDIDAVIDVIKTTFKRYVSLELDIGFYREFSFNSRFKIRYDSCSDIQYYMDNITDDYKKYIDISYNMNIIIYLYKLFSNIYFTSRHGKLTLWN